MLNFHPAISHPELVSPTITTLLKNWNGATPVEEILVSEINPEFMMGEVFSREYNIPPAEGANCLIVEGTRGNKKTYAACLVLVNSRINFKEVVRKQLGAKVVSLAPLDYVLKETQMEYGSITVMGLPSDWPILIDSRLITLPRVIIGGGLTKSKLSLPGKALAEIPNAVVIEGLATIVE